MRRALPQAPFFVHWKAGSLRFPPLSTSPLYLGLRSRFEQSFAQSRLRLSFLPPTGCGQRLTCQNRETFRHPVLRAAAAQRGVT